ncbi:amidohydrolase [Henriciella aquimarina]|uniref:amidohydrolase n=1 Tax=Henriciella aquimarina TaxID=545261 RepID=UPI0009FF41C2|nr:amidohydrolase [Henriciella aquimarina]
MFNLLRVLAISCLAVAPSCAVAQRAAPVDDEPATAIVNATILTASSPMIENGTVVFDDGEITAVGQTVDIPANANIIDASGRWVTPGLIDPHSHLGVFPTPLLPTTMDLNEKSGNNTAQVSAGDAIWPQDPGFDMARAGGVTSIAILPGSSNMFGGRGVSIKNIETVSPQDMIIPGAPEFLKMACGENPIKVYGGKGQAPFTRMGVIAEFRKAWAEATRYRDARDAAEGTGNAPPVDFQMETMAGVLDGEIIPVLHCYRADEMLQMIEVSHEFGFQIGAFHHATEAYKIADILAEENIAVAAWARRWGFKMEAYDAIDAEVAMLEDAGVTVSLHSDNALLIQRMNIEAAMALASAKRAGYDDTYETAIKWVTARPAKLMGIDDRTGTLEPGKMADIVIWSGDPFSVYSHAEEVFIDGDLAYSRADDEAPVESDSDFLTGQSISGE